MTKQIAACLIAGTSLLALGTQAFAQDADVERIETGAGNLDVILVTAQKRAQNLQDVPIAISAIGADKVEQLGIQDARDLSGLAPNVTVVGGTVSNTSAVVSIRGIASGAQETFGIDSNNAIYVDGIYIARNGAAGLDVADIERIEVLRGPQGTLFGRNTTGGAISFVSRAPSDDLRVQAEAGYGNFDSWNAKLSVDPGEIAGIRTSFSYSHRERDGYVDNILTPDSRDPGALRQDSYRAAAAFDLGSTGSVRYIFDYAKVRGVPTAFQLTNVADGSPRPPVSVDGQLVTVTQQAPVAQYLANAEFLEPGCAALGVPTKEYRDTLCLNSQGRSTDEIYGHNFQVINDFGGFQVKTLTGFRFWNNEILGSDIDGLGTIRGPLFSQASLLNGLPEELLAFIPTIPEAARPFIANAEVPTTTADLFTTSNDRKHKQFSQEIEFSGDASAFDWVAGGFYFWEKGSEDNPQTSVFVLDTNQIFLGSFGALGPALAAANPERYRAVVTPAVLRYTATNESYALYGQTTVYPAGRDAPLSVTAGARYTWDERTIVRLQNGPVPADGVERGNQDFSRFTWNLMGRYEFTPEISVYARAATGYRSGGFNAQDPVIPGTNQIPSFDEETVMSYEIGLKSELFDRAVRLNVAGYYNQYDDLAVVVPLAGPPGTFGSRIANAGSVDYKGVEADIQAILNRNFSVDGSIGYVDIKYKEFLAGRPLEGGEPVNIASVITPGYTSPLTANAALNARFDVGSRGIELIGRVGYTYEDGKYSFSSDISSPFNEELKGGNRHLLDAQLTLAGVTLGGAEAEVMIWGKNLLDDVDLFRGIDFGQLGFAGGYYSPPRTYGTTVRVKY
ncbi:TonB-dependent receptor [Croceicoccus sp. F390]|uniref:TonB-dependent receptor n=1 Tax=Croceicoccus esteveae TaxID=3075597 RepID=A0ABU2ZHE8_9SPHN|nr:TonB-dependent receptor [Croceicoccus sp. F390]MDT0576024.1 TonB-dependent receptor [Croceicoccus sp. F390]